MRRWLRRKTSASQLRKRISVRVLRFDQLEDRRLLSADWLEYDGDDSDGHDDDYADESKPTERVVLQQRSVVRAADDSGADDDAFGKSPDHEYEHKYEYEHEREEESENEDDDSQTTTSAGGAGWSSDTAAAFESDSLDIDGGDDSLGALTANDLLRAIYSNSPSSAADSRNVFDAIDSQDLLGVGNVARPGSGSLPISSGSNLGSQSNSGLVAASDSNGLASNSSPTAHSTPKSSSEGSITTPGNSEADGDESGTSVRAANGTSTNALPSETTDEPGGGAETDSGESDPQAPSSVASDSSDVEAAKLTGAENDQPPVEGLEADAAVEASALANTGSHASPPELKSRDSSHADASQAGLGAGAEGGTTATGADSSTRTGVSPRPTNGLAVPSSDTADGAAPASPSTVDNSGEGQLFTALSGDLKALETTLKNLFAGRVDNRGELIDWIANLDAFDWTIVAAIALLTVDAARRKRHPSLENRAFPFDGQDELLRLFPEFFGIRAAL